MKHKHWFNRSLRAWNNDWWMSLEVRVCCEMSGMFRYDMHECVTDQFPHNPSVTRPYITNHLTNKRLPINEFHIEGYYLWTFAFPRVNRVRLHRWNSKERIRIELRVIKYTQTWCTRTMVMMKTTFLIDI